MSEKREKILFVITKSNWGGAQRYVFDLATSLQHDFEVVVALGGNGRLRQVLEAHGIRIIELPHLERDISLKKEFLSFFDTIRMIRAERPDILHLNSSKAGGMGALAGRLALVKKIVFTAHAWAWNEDRSFISRALIGALHFITVMLAHRTICVSNAIYDQMARIPFTRRRMRVVHLGITPPPRIMPAQARAYLAEQMPELRDMNERIWIGTIGELHPVKGHRYALAALETLKATTPNLLYLMIGDGEARASLERETTARGLSDIVRFMGHVDDASALMPAFDIMLVPSLSEAFCYVVAESGAAGLPVIATSVGGIPEIIENGMGILVPARNPEAMTEALRDVLSNPKSAADRALTLETRVRAYFTKERMVEETTHLYAMMG